MALAEQRYQYGYLRIDRLDLIYLCRFFLPHPVRGYLYAYKCYTPFFKRNFSWVLIPFVLLSVVLSAMQVGTGLETLGNNKTFLNASYGIALFSMVCVLAIVTAVAIINTFLSVYNGLAAITQANRDQWKRRKLARDRFENQL